MKLKRMICLACCVMLLMGAAHAAKGTLRLPAAVREIGDEAFCGDSALYEVILPSGVSSIGARAFAQSSIRRITLPDTISFIADDAFDGCNLEYAKASGNYCILWCNSHGIRLYKPSYEGEEIIID